MVSLLKTVFPAHIWQLLKPGLQTHLHVKTKQMFWIHDPGADPKSGLWFPLSLLLLRNLPYMDDLP